MLPLFPRVTAKNHRRPKGNTCSSTAMSSQVSGGSSCCWKPIPPQSSSKPWHQHAPRTLEVIQMKTFSNRSTKGSSTATLKSSHGRRRCGYTSHKLLICPHTGKRGEEEEMKASDSRLCISYARIASNRCSVPVKRPFASAPQRAQTQKPNTGN